MSCLHKVVIDIRIFLSHFLKLCLIDNLSFVSYFIFQFLYRHQNEHVIFGKLQFGSGSWEVSIMSTDPFMGLLTFRLNLDIFIITISVDVKF